MVLRIERNSDRLPGGLTDQRVFTVSVLVSITTSLVLIVVVIVPWPSARLFDGAA